MSFSRRNRWTAEQLAYCSNVHPGETLDEVERIVAGEIRAVRSLRGLSTMASGLWLSARAAKALAGSDRALRRFRRRLDLCGIRLTTLNGFPYGGFHERSVKQAVYRPDWTDPKRAVYTLTLARVLASCLPDDEAFGSISTLPLGEAGALDANAREAAAAALCEVAIALDRLRGETGRTIVVGLEMEPGCALEATAECVRFFSETLTQAAAGRLLSQETLRRHIGVCFDVCHQAVMFEDPAESLSSLTAAGIGIAKIQLSSAIEVPYPDRPSCRNAVATYAEPRYLHQVRMRRDDGLHGRMDLPDALGDDPLPYDAPWRVHFHVPVQVRLLASDRLATTRPALLRVLDYLARSDDLRPHLEVETYTWQVLPRAIRPRGKPGVRAGLSAELKWVEAQMAARGLLRDDDA